MLKGFEEETAPLTEAEKALAPGIALLLQAHANDGDMRWTTGAEIAEYLDTHPVRGKVKARKIIHYIRCTGLAKCVIASSKGYRIAQSQQEVEYYLESLDGRIKAMPSVRRAIAAQAQGAPWSPSAGELFDLPAEETFW